MLQDREIAIDQFIKVTAGGLQIADYDQVLAAVSKMYRETYGSDIDLANTTADGIFVHNLALIINNILQSVKTVYGNLDVDTASGVYLDSLCKLSNVTRHSATHSTAQLAITALTTSTLASGTEFVDDTGTVWTYNGSPIEISSSAADATVITVECNELGAVKANAGSISKTLEASYFEVSQPNDANVGLEEESDADLRARRTQSTGAQGITVLESIVGSLLDVVGIKDVQIINNNTSSAASQTDTTSVPAHSIYVIVRREPGIAVTDETIGTIIYNKLTPGIKTTQFTTSANGIAHSYSKMLSPLVSWVNQVVYWKEAIGIHPSCSITITKNQFFAGDSTTNAVANAIKNYLNNIKLSEMPTANDMIITATYADPTFKGRSTYSIKAVDISGISTNPNTFFNYTTASTSTSGDDITITFS